MQLVRTPSMRAVASAALLSALACDPVEEGHDVELELDEEVFDDFAEEPEDDEHVPPTATEEIEATTDPAAAVTGSFDYAIISVASGKCATAVGNQIDSQIRQENCVFDASQRFDKISGYRLQNVGSGLCVDSVYGWLSQQMCGPWAEQKFYDVHDGSGSEIRYIREYNLYRCWDVPNATNGSEYLQTFPCHGNFNQDWMVIPVY